MPWDASTVMVGTLGPDGGDRAEVAVAGGPGESAMQPRWLDERLILLSDRTGWWNLYRVDDAELRPLHPEDAEFGGPQWTLGQSPYAVLDDDHLVCTVNRGGRAVAGDPHRVDRRAGAGRRQPASPTWPLADRRRVGGGRPGLPRPGAGRLPARRDDADLERRCAARPPRR